MRIINNNKEVAYGITGNGQYYRKTAVPGATLIETTTNPLKFLKMLLDGHGRIEQKAPYRYAYHCLSCEQGFDEGHGQEIEKMRFCTSCVDQFEHFEYLRRVEKLEDDTIYELSAQAKNL